MPTKVTGADGRLLHDNLDDQAAGDLARSVHAATGEEVTLTPLVYDGAEYVEDRDGIRVFGAAPPEEEPTEEQPAPEKKNARKRAARGE